MFTALRPLSLFSRRLLVTTIATLSIFPNRSIIRAEKLCSSTNGGDDASKVKQAADRYTSGDTIFGKILRKEIPADIVYEDDKCIAFKDVNPVAPIHLLVIPRKPIERLSDTTADDAELLGHLLLTAKTVAKQEGLAESGFRLVINDGRDGAQSVYHLHIHIIGGRLLNWPPG